MEWTLSQLHIKITYLWIIPFSGILFSTFLYLILKTNLGIHITISGIIIGCITILIYKLGQRVEAWDYPRIVKIEDNRLRVLWYDVDKKKYVDKIRPIDFDSIYQIVIKDKFFSMYYVLDGKKYLTGFALDGFFIRHITKEVEKRKQILNEVLKRIDKSKVKIIDKRRRKKFKIEGGDR